MSLWIVFAVLTAAVLAAIARPFVKARGSQADRAAYDRAIYSDQLAELERDKQRGVIGPVEAEAARNEIARRLLAAKDAPATQPPAHGRAMALAGMAMIPVVGIGLYVLFGSPQLPDVPRRERIEAAVENQDMPALIAKVEAHLAQNPNDIQGWTVLAPAYRKMERYDDAANAYANLLRLSAPNAELFADYAESLVLANRGLVLGDAAKAFGEALKLDPQHPKSLYYGGLGLKQEGKTPEALAVWRKLVAVTPADAPWRKELEADIAQLETPGPDTEQIAAAEQMSPEDRQAMIRGMVDGLEQKLKADGSDIEGWQRLIRARMVLGETTKAREAYDAARARFSDKPEILASLEGLAKELGVK